jgi:hypothetical protein
MISATLFSLNEQRSISTGQNLEWFYTKISKVHKNSYIGINKLERGAFGIADDTEFYGKMYMMPSYKFGSNWYVCPILDFDTVNSYQDLDNGWYFDISDNDSKCFKYTDKTQWVTADLDVQFNYEVNDLGQAKINVNTTANGVNPDDTGFGFFFVPENSEKYRYVKVNGQNYDLINFEGDVPIDKVFEFMDLNGNPIRDAFDWNLMTDTGNYFSKIETIAGKKGFFVGTYGYGASNFIEIDPLFLVDYSPVPSGYLINATTLIEADSAFQTNIDITTNMSNNVTDDGIYINPEFQIGGGFTVQNETTISTNEIDWVTYNEFNWTPSIEGYYFLGFSAHANTNSTDYDFQHRVMIDDLPIHNINMEMKEDSVSNNLISIPFSYFQYFSSSSEYNFKLQFSTENPSSISTIHSPRITFWNTPLWYHEEVIGEQDIGTTETEIDSLSGVSPMEMPFVIFASGEAYPNSNSHSLYVNSYIDGVEVLGWRKESKDIDTWYPFSYFYVDNYSAGNHYMNVTAQEEVSTNSKVRNVHMTALPIDSDYGYASVEAETLIQNGTFVNHVDLNFTPASEQEYVVMATAQVGTSNTNQRLEVQFEADSVNKCKMIAESKEGSNPRDMQSFLCHFNTTLDVSEHNFNIQIKSQNGFSPVYIKYARIFVVSIDTIDFTNDAITGNWANTYNSTYSYFTNLYKETSTNDNITIYAYDDADNLSTQKVSKNLAGSGYFDVNVTSLVDYMTNTQGLNFTKLRVVSPDSRIKISELYLRQEGNDTQVPTIDGCKISLDGGGEQTNFGCQDVIEFECNNITDDISVDFVNFEINGTNVTTFFENNHWHYYLNVASEGTFQYNWTAVYATDIFGNSNFSNVDLQANYTCNYTDYFNIQHDPLTNVTDITDASATIKWSTDIPSDSRINYGTQSGNLNKSIFTSPLVTVHQIGIVGLDASTTYFYEVVSRRNPNQTLGEFNFTTLSGCTENWYANDSNCLVNDSFFAEYIDLNDCGTFEDFPETNGTYESCNYCSEDLIQNLGVCLANESQSVTYTDQNYFTCCQVTNISTDCSILIFPYNTTTYQSCVLYEEQLGDPLCPDQFNFNVKEKENCIVYVPTNFTNESFKCIAYVSNNESEIIQTTPIYNERGDSFFDIFSGEKETREYYTPANRIVNVYVTQKNLLPDQDYVLTIECNSELRTLKSQHPFVIEYQNFDFVFTRTEWLYTNWAYILGAIFVTFMLIVIILFFYRGAIK